MARVLTQALASVPRVRRYRGYVTYIYAFDVAYEMDRRPVTTVLGQPVVPLSVDTNKRAPRQLFFYRPLTVKLPAMEREGPGGPVQVERQVKIFSVGGLSITVRVPFDVESIGELVQYHDLRFKGGAEEKVSNLHEEVLALAEEVREELKEHWVRRWRSWRRMRRTRCSASRRRWIRRRGGTFPRRTGWRQIGGRWRRC